MSFRLKSGRELELPTNEKQAARYLADMITHRGELPDSDESVEWEDFAETLLSKDTQTTSELQPLLEQSVELIIREPIEPMLVITGLYNPVRSKGLSTRVLAGALGAVYAQDVQEHGTYPEVSIQVGGAVQTAWIGKSGIAASFTDEALRYTTWDILAMNLRLMGAAMARLKEQKAVSFLTSLGTTLFDNATPANSLFGVCTGRDITLNANGTMTMDDLMRGYAHMTEEGFPPSIILVHPMTYFMWLRDPVMRLMMLNFGGGEMFNPWSGNTGPRSNWSNGSMGAMGPSTGHKLVPGGSASGESATGLTGRSQLANSGPNVPGYFPFSMSVMASPFVPYDPETNLCDVYLLSAGNVGFYMIDEDLQQVQWRDEDVEAVKVKLRERYGFAVAHEGQGVGVYKNVYTGRNYFDETVSGTAVSPSAITSTATISPLGGAL
jgi:hypothetical protein